ncbi:hypothetical protein BNJ_00273 [Kaumoebavirus]|uniref:hypothetical protein n=1 Tax=Kaumoebavirus TaxID=1859492 RepID=UPI0009C330F7|nr:hypothetical protein BNJ_00273 [Kaumoebavirus]ARA72097.1 hypothetical protein BNJ_00273 [Kaumoebavirus]
MLVFPYNILIIRGSSNESISFGIVGEYKVTGVSEEVFYVYDFLCTVFNFLQKTD